MKRALPILLGLAGCAHAPEPVVQVREVPVVTMVPTPVRCVNPDDIPPEPRRVGEQFNGDARHDLAILAPNAQELRKWGREMRTLLEKCVGKSTPR
jgi:hypothetical protein